MTEPDDAVFHKANSQDDDGLEEEAKTLLVSVLELPHLPIAYYLIGKRCDTGKRLLQWQIPGFNYRACSPYI